MWDYLGWGEAYVARLRELRDSPYMRYPRDVSIETMSLCNAVCDFCPYPKLERKGTAMSDALIEKILNDCGDIPSNVPFDMTLCRVNEPFLDTRIFDIASRIAHKLPQASVLFFSNGSPLNEKNLLRLAEARNVSRLVISMHENRPEEYERILGIPFARTLRNVERLHQMKAQGAIAFDVELSRVGDGTAQDQAFCEWGRAKFPLFAVYSTARADWIGAVNTPVAPVLAIPCRQWFKINILANGKVAFRGGDSEAHSLIGNAIFEHILDIYNSPRRLELRRTLVSRLELHECSRCPLAG